MRFAVFHGNERWILRGLAIDIESSLKLGHTVSRIETDLSNPDDPHLLIITCLSARAT